MCVATWGEVARIVGELALTSEPSPHDWRVGKKLLAWERPLRPSEREALERNGPQPPQGDILGVRVSDEGVKFALIDDEPGPISPPRISMAIPRCWSTWPRSRSAISRS